MSETDTRRCDVLVIGTGGAGLRAAIAARQAGAQVLLLGKRGLRDAHTVLAAGGINAALGTRDPEDSWEQHFADTLRESYFLAHPRVVELMASEAPAAVLELAEWGCAFARTEDGRLDQRYFGAHTYRRTCYAGDHTGREVIHTLVARVEALGIPVAEHQYVARLLLQDGRCVGALGFDVRTAERTAYLSGAVILCAGGHTGLWHRNTSRVDESWGEGMALALEAGCRLMDMELVQFHPTGMVAPQDVAGTLVTEAVRGEGGRLFNALGERFMQRYDAARMELSTRDRVALANYLEIREGRGGPHGGVFLDISHRGLEFIKERLPRMYGQFLSFQGLDISRGPMEVAPTAHYSMGGISVEPDSHATDVPGLYAAGECASGLHGANRLGGNSLVDILVFGRRAGQAAAESALGDHPPFPPESRAAASQANDWLEGLLRSGGEATRTLAGRLRDAMWEDCGVLRDETGLRFCLGRLEDLAGAVGEAEAPAGAAGGLALAGKLDLRAGLLTAEATVRGALHRRETRGCHNRADFPAARAELLVNLYASLDPGRGEMRLERVPVPPVPPELHEWAGQTHDIPEHERLLE